MCKGLVCAQTLEGLLRVARGGVCVTGGLDAAPLELELSAGQGGRAEAAAGEPQGWRGMDIMSDQRGSEDWPTRTKLLLPPESSK